MTIKWGDPIECNGMRPDWLRDDEPCTVLWAATSFGDEKWSDLDSGEYTVWNFWGSGNWKAFRLRDDHPAYVALARGFHPWSGGESAPDDWDAAQPVLFRDRFAHTGAAWHWGHCDTPHPRDIIGYGKRNTRFDEPHLARIEVGGSVPVEGVFIKRMTPAAIVERWTEVLSLNGTYEDDVVEFCRRLGLVQDESRAERFTRETGHAVTEAVEAALNWKGE